MFTKKEIKSWYLRKGIRAEARALIDEIRNSEPVRKVRGYGSSVIGQYPSKKMQRTLQFESHRCELSFIQLQDAPNNDVEEIWDQPTKAKISYKTKSGRTVTVDYVPDFFVITKDCGEFIECKTEEELLKLAEDQPNKFYRDENGVWHCPPAEAWAARYGLRHRIRSTASINKIYVRNLEFFDDYIRRNDFHVSSEARDHVVSIVKEHNGITLLDLLNKIEPSVAEADDVNKLILCGDVYVNLSTEPIPERQFARVYADAETAEIFNPIASTPTTPRAEQIFYAEKTRLIWDSKPWEIVNVGEEKVWLIGEKGDASFQHARFEQLIGSGTIKLLQPEEDGDTSALAMELLRNAKPKHYAEALRRKEQMMPFLNGEKKLTGRKKERSIRRYIAKYKEAQAIYGVGLVGLIPNWVNQGIRKRRLPDEVHEIMERLIKEEYETLAQQNITLVYGKVLNKCEEKEIPEEHHPTYETFRTKVAARDKGELTRKRKGKRAAYAHEKIIYWIDKDTPPQGDRPFHIAHADHTKLDIEIICPHTGQNLGRPWASFLVDAYTRRLLAIVITFDPPSYRSTMMLFRECVRRHGRLPQITIVDRGSEFDNLYLRRFAAFFELVIKFRPKAKPKHGSVGERLFGIGNTQFVHTLMGNTQIMKEIRKVTKSVNPKNLAVWTLKDFTEWFTAWGYIVYDQRPHWTLLQSPIEAHTRAIELTGRRRKSFIKFDENFLILTMPATRKLTAKNNPDKGIKINNIYYHHLELDSPSLTGKQLYVRYDPHNISIAYVYTGHHWVKCLSEYYGTFAYMTEKQLAIISAEIRRRKQKHLQQLSITARQLAGFIESAEKVQKSLAARKFLNQRQKDIEVKPLFQLINGGLAGVASDKHVTAKPPTVGAEVRQEIEAASHFSAIDFSKLKKLGGL